MYHYSKEEGPTPGWTYNSVTNGNLVGEDAYGGFPNAANVYGYNSSKLLAAYGTSAITASSYLSSTYFDLGYRTVNYVVTVAAKESGDPYFGTGSDDQFVIRGDEFTTPTAAPTINFTRANTYIFNQNDSTNTGNPIYLSTTDDGVHNGGVKYSSGVTYRLNGAAVDAVTYANSFATASERTVTIVVPQDAPNVDLLCRYRHQNG